MTIEHYKIYLIVNSKYKDVKIVATDIEKAIKRYRCYLYNEICPNDIFEHITSVSYLDDYKEEI